MASKLGRIILLNGTSSSGKSTLAQALRPELETEVRFAWRETFFDGFHRSIPAFASVGLDLLVEHIVEEKHWAEQLKVLLAPFDVFWVGVHAPVAEIERREILRGNRQLGEGLYHLKTHQFCTYNVEVDTTNPTSENVKTIINGWNSRPKQTR